MLENKIEAIKPYFDGWFILEESKNGIRTILPKEWVIYGKKTEKVNITPRRDYDNNTNKVMFIGDQNTKIVDIVEFIEEIVLNNIENEAKKQLFAEKIEELASVFDSNKLTLLKTLVFKFEKHKKNKKIVEKVDEAIDTSKTEE